MKQYLLIILVALSLNAYADSLLSVESSYIVSTEMNKGEGDVISLYPNPAKNSFFIEVNNTKSEVKEINLYSLLGTSVLVIRNNFSKDKIEVNISSLKKGKYLVKVSFADGTSEVKALIKQ
ncbi:T9SS type A sorting domain-containing protein [Weeksellaceae bacterium TAE3-ERU29]|nr:T9SS type A sorting domain-containing protein [Weeksellaceae bacterium TAE3-ERU29]